MMRFLCESISKASATVLTAIISTAGVLTLTNQSAAQGVAPNGSVSVTYQQVDEGKISPGYHELTLSCYSGVCELQTITFNQCWDLGSVGSGSYSFIKAERVRTDSGNLKIISASKHTLVLEHRIVGGIITYRFSYKLGDDGTLGLLSLTDFSGAGSKNSDILGRAISWQLVPLRTTDGRHFETVKTDCPIRVAALPGK
jgi:hypothetical protein